MTTAGQRCRETCERRQINPTKTVVRETLCIRAALVGIECVVAVVDVGGANPRVLIRLRLAQGSRPGYSLFDRLCCSFGRDAAATEALGGCDSRRLECSRDNGRRNAGVPEKLASSRACFCVLIGSGNCLLTVLEIVVVFNH